MRLLFLSDHLKKGQFMVTGLHYENLFPDLSTLDDFQRLHLEQLFRYDGIFLAVSNYTFLEAVVDSFLQIKPHIPIMLLANEYHSLCSELLFLHKISKFFIRPFPFRVMASEMRSLVFQQRERMQKSIVTIRHLELNREAHQIRLDGQTIYLRNKEYALLEFLMLNSGKVLSRGTILEHVWDRNANIFTNTVDVHINKLRKKIDHQDNERFIRTIPCAGYLFA